MNGLSLLLDLSLHSCIVCHFDPDPYGLIADDVRPGLHRKCPSPIEAVFLGLLQVPFASIPGFGKTRRPGKRLGWRILQDFREGGFPFLGNWELEAACYPEQVWPLDEISRRFQSAFWLSASRNEKSFGSKPSTERGVSQSMPLVGAIIPELVPVGRRDSPQY